LAAPLQWGHGWPLPSRSFTIRSTPTGFHASQALRRTGLAREQEAEHGRQGERDGAGIPIDTERTGMIWCQQTVKLGAVKLGGATAITLAMLPASLLELSCVRPVPAVPAIQVYGLDAEVRDAIQTDRNRAVAQPKARTRVVRTGSPILLAQIEQGLTQLGSPP